MKLTDFGEHIKGARKEEYAGVCPEEIWEMSDAERAKFVKRDTLWPLPDAKALVEAGADAFVVYWQRAVRRATKSAPIVNDWMSKEYVIKEAVAYTEQMAELRKRVESVASSNDLLTTSLAILQDINKYSSCIHVSQIYDACDVPKLKAKCLCSNFPYEKTSKERKEGKKEFPLARLSSLERGNLPDWRCGMDVDPEMWQDRLHFKGVQYGNYVTEKERQKGTNFAFEAFCDLALACDIAETDISFDRTLSLAFGARGRGNARAHYEPAYEIINLTRLSGAGCLAHEWFHALDYALAQFYGIHSGRLASECIETDMLPSAFVTFIKSLQRDSRGRWTDFARGSREFDARFRKSGFGYWSSRCEMAARAFACYVKDSLNERSDYLCAHADTYTFDFDNEKVCAIPQGDEREMFNEMLDMMFASLKREGFLHPRTGEESCRREITVCQRKDGQYMIV